MQSTHACAGAGSRVHLPDARMLLPWHALDLLRSQRQVLAVSHLSRIKICMRVVMLQQRMKTHTALPFGAEAFTSGALQQHKEQGHIQCPCYRHILS
jgi:hypothetical protein